MAPHTMPKLAQGTQWYCTCTQHPPRAHLLLSVVLLQVEEVEDVRVPRLKVHCEGALALAAALRVGYE